MKSNECLYCTIETVSIPLEEYKQLLMIKGKYEELKSLYRPQTYPTITYRSFDKETELKPPYKVTCENNTCECDAA